MAGLSLLKQRYEVVCAPGLLARTGYLAGSDGRRLAELRWALGDPSVRGIFCARGGYGLMRYLDALEAMAIAERRAIPLVGFSDITVLLAWAARGGLISIHGPVVTQLGELPEEDRASLFALLAGAAPPPLTGLSVVRPGRARGRLLGGNLEMLSRLCGSPTLQALLPGEPVVLLLEEVGERPYRIDRALTQLLMSGALAQVAAVVIGDLVRCAEPNDQAPTALEVIAERLDTLGVPIAAGAPIGHGTRNRAVPHGALVELSTADGMLKFL